MYNIYLSPILSATAFCICNNVVLQLQPSVTCLLIIIRSPHRLLPSSIFHLVTGRVRITVLVLNSSLRFLFERVTTVDAVLTITERTRPSLPAMVQQPR